MPHSPITSTTVTPPAPAPPPQGYDGTSPFPPDGPAPPRDGGERLYVTVTAVIVVLPFVAIGLAGWLLWGRLIHPADIVLALVLYTITGLGVTVGFHRGLTHGGYRAVRPVRIALAVAGPMSFQGDVIGWVATHRRHHAFTDEPGDPHSPYRYGTHLRGQLRGLLHAHVGWLFRNDRTPADRYAPDLLADRDIRRIARAFLLTLALPFGAGWLIGGTWLHALTALLWAGIIRIALLHHVTWSVNSLCHMIGERPFRTRATTGPRTCGPSPCSRSVRAGTTSTTPTPPAPAMASTAASSTPPPPSSASWNASAGCTTCAGPLRTAWPPAAPDTGHSPPPPHGSWLKLS